MPAPVTAVLFDVDGTLVDSNYLHVDAWDRALVDVGRPVDTWRIHRVIGMDSSELLKALLGDDAARLTDEVKARHKEHYGLLMPRLRSFGGAQELVRALARSGRKVVLATSAPPEELEVLRRLLGVEDALAELTSSADVRTAKPEPGIVEVALEKAGVPAERAVMVGDAVWDVQSAGRAGVRWIGVQSGGIGAAELRDAGAVEVYEDVQQLLDRLATSVIG